LAIFEQDRYRHQPCWEVADVFRNARLLALFTLQAALGLDLLQRARTAHQALEGNEDAGVVARLASTVLAHEQRREDALQLLAVLDRLLANQAAVPPGKG
jgi:hypothetical protein